MVVGAASAHVFHKREHQCGQKRYATTATPQRAAVRCRCNAPRKRSYPSLPSRAHQGRIRQRPPPNLRWFGVGSRRAARRCRRAPTSPLRRYCLGCAARPGNEQRRSHPRPKLPIVADRHPKQLRLFGDSALQPRARPSGDRRRLGRPSVYLRHGYKHFRPLLERARGAWCRRVWLALDAVPADVPVDNSLPDPAPRPTARPATNLQARP